MRAKIPATILVAALVASAFVGIPALAGKKPPLTALRDTAWLYSGFYKTKAKKTGQRDAYSLEFIIDFFNDGTFALQDVPIEEGDDFFSGEWIQYGNKTILLFDQFSQQLLADIFSEQFTESEGFEGPVEVFIERWELIAKLRRDRTGVVFMKYKEKLRHVAISEGIPIRVKTKGKGTGDFFEEISE